MKSTVIISFVLALFALVFPIALSAANPITAAAEEAQEPEQPPLVYTEIREAPKEEKDRSVTLKLKRGDSIIDISMADYLVGVVAAEMPASFESEALKAQAVAARTYTLYKMRVNPSPNHPDADACDDHTCCKAYRDDGELREKWGDSYTEYRAKIADAVSATDGEYLVYDGEPILAVFHSSSNGKTESAENVWGAPVPYLVPVDSIESGDSVPNYESVVTVASSDFADTVKSKYPDADFSGSVSDWITDTEYSDSGRLLTAKVGGVTVKGTELRTMFELRSTGMDIAADGDSIVFTVTGYGHGVGMSQYGADAMAKKGSTYDDILLWYYPNTSITTD